VEPEGDRVAGSGVRERLRGTRGQQHSAASPQTKEIKRQKAKIKRQKSLRRAAGRVGKESSGAGRNQSNRRKRDESRETPQQMNLYPTPCTVRKRWGSPGSCSILARREAMWLSTVRVVGKFS